MGQLSSKLRNVAFGGLTFWCPGCNGAHMIRATVRRQEMPAPDATDPDWTPPAVFYEERSGAWSWNGHPTRPTFLPSILVRYDGADAGQDLGDGRRAPPAICHSFVTDGRIQFLGDCTHSLAGQTVDLPDWPQDWG